MSEYYLIRTCVIGILLATTIISDLDVLGFFVCLFEMSGWNIYDVKIDARANQIQY